MLPLIGDKYDATFTLFDDSRFSEKNKKQIELEEIETNWLSSLDSHFSEKHSNLSRPTIQKWWNG